MKARELAADYPALGIGPGYVANDMVDDTDYAGRLWEVLRETDERVPRKYDPDIIGEAAAHLAEANEDAARAAAREGRAQADD